MIKRIFLTIFLISFAFAFLKFNPGWSYPELIDRVIAVVNGKVITEYELQRKTRILGKELEKTVLQQMINNCLLEQEAEKKNIKVSPLEVEEAIIKIKKNLSEERFLQILKEQELSFNELKTQLKGQILQEKLLSQKTSEVREEIKIQEDEIKGFYQKLKDYLQGKIKEGKDIERFYQLYQEKLKQVQIAQIIVKGKDKAQQVNYLLEKGEDFSTLAKDFSLTPEAKEGGDLGWFNFFQIKSSLREEILKLRKNEISKMFKIEDDYYRFIKLKDKRELLFNEWSDKIKDYLFQIRMEEAIQDWIAKLRSKGEIIIIDPSLQ